ncbi:MAG TPA: DUF1698 domain-containing protein [Bryobacteraceae bacterium]|nr:DUF1698 domain-containing protein [Bryobacteraceae bacterium]
MGINRREELCKEALGRHWFHTIDLGDIVTPGVDRSAEKLARLQMPARLDGLTVLDVGAYDGFFSFEAERRGAKRVVATDKFCWSLTGMGDGRGFDIAHELLHSRVEKKVIAVEDISAETVGVFDLVLFLGVLYHAPDPLGYLRRVRSVCKSQLILETHVDALDYPRPAMVFYPGSTLNNDPSNHFGPNLLAVEAMLTEVGFGRVVLLQQYGTRIVVHAFVDAPR